MTQFTLDYSRRESKEMPLDTLRSILVVGAVLLAIGVNYWAEAVELFGVSTKEVSDDNYTLITPAGPAFSIWGLIYLGTVSSAIYLFLHRHVSHFRAAGWWLVIASLANASFPLTFHTGNMAFSMVSMAILLLSLIQVQRNIMADRASISQREYWMLQVPARIYLGWVAAATTVNFTQLLQQWGVELPTQADHIAASVVLLVLAGVALFFTFKARERFFALTVAWALFWILIAQKQEAIVPYVAGFGIAAIVAYAVGSYVVEHMQNRTRSADRVQF